MDPAARRVILEMTAKIENEIAAMEHHLEDLGATVASSSKAYLKNIEARTLAIRGVLRASDWE